MSMEPIKSVLCECDAIRVECVGARLAKADCFYGRGIILVDVRYPNGNVGTVEMTQENAWQLKHWLKELVPGTDPTPYEINRMRAKRRKSVK